MSLFLKNPLSIEGEFSFSFYYAVGRKLEAHFNAPIVTIRTFANDVKLCICSALVLANTWDCGL